jgi:glutaredoxin 3
MQPVQIYSKYTCGFCMAAKRLLISKGVSFEEVDILDHPERRAEMIQKANGRSTVPQIFIGGKHLGGYDDLAATVSAGKLEKLLAA